MRPSASGSPRTSTSGCADRGSAVGDAKARTSKPSLRSWRSRKPRIVGSGSARSSAVMTGDASRASAPAIDVLSRESATSCAHAAARDVATSAIRLRSNLIAALCLQPAGADDAPEEPDAEHAREDEADHRDDVDAEHVRTAL